MHPKPEPRTKVRRTIPIDVRAEVLDRDGWTCQFCRMSDGGHLVLHHRLRRSQGGADDARTLVSLHPVCHGHVHDHPAEAMERGFLVHSAAELDAGWR